eukprot:11370823-Ditylum_brightwellii.AAC.1
MPKATVHATHKYGGIGILHPKTELLVKVQFILKHLWLADSMEKIISIVIRWAQNNNSHIMDHFLETHHILSTDFHHLNYYRCYLEVTTIAKLATSGRKYIQEKYFYPKEIQQKEGMTQRVDPTTWPRQEQPSKTIWELWNIALQKTDHGSQPQTNGFIDMMDTTYT